MGHADGTTRQCSHDISQMVRSNAIEEGEIIQVIAQDDTMIMVISPAKHRYLAYNKEGGCGKQVWDGGPSCMHRSSCNAATATGLVCNKRCCYSHNHSHDGCCVDRPIIPYVLKTDVQEY